MNVGGQSEPNSFHVYEDVDEMYCNEMLSERKVIVRKGNRQRERWVKKHGRKQNHYWDTEVYNRAIAKLLRIDALRAGQLDSRSRRPSRQRGRRPGRTGFGGQRL